MIKRVLLVAMSLALLPSIAQARPHHGYLYGCGEAARAGGPCGCIAAKLSGLGNRRDLWAVSSWLRYPRVAAAPGAVMIWPGRHVAKVIAVHGRRITVHDSYGVRSVRSTGIFVRPHA